MLLFSLQRNRRINSGEWTASSSQPVLRPKFDPTSLAGRGGSNRGQSGGSGSNEVTLGPRRKNKQITKFGSTDSESGHSSRTATPTNTMKNRFDLLDDDDLAEATTMTKSSSFNRRPSEGKLEALKIKFNFFVQCQNHQNSAVVRAVQ